MTGSHTKESLALDKRIIRLYLVDELTLAAVGEKVGMTPEGVRQRLIKAGIRKRPPRGIRARAIEIRKVTDAMTAAGASLGAIAAFVVKKYGLVERTVRDYSRDRRMEIRKKRLQRAVSLYAIHKNIYKVGEIMSVNDQTILNWLHQSGVDTSAPRGFDPKTKARALKLLKRKGATLLSVAATIGCSKGALSNWIREAKGGIRIRTRSPNEAKRHLEHRRLAAAKIHKAEAERDRKALAVARKVLAAR